MHLLSGSQFPHPNKERVGHFQVTDTIRVAGDATRKCKSSDMSIQHFPVGWGWLLIYLGFRLRDLYTWNPIPTVQQHRQGEVASNATPRPLASASQAATITRFLGDLRGVSMPVVWGSLSQATLRLAGAESSVWATSEVLQAFAATTGTQTTPLSFPICQGDK